MKKNDLLQIKIEAMGNAGEGIGKIDGYPLFVKDALPGDLAEVRVTKVKKTYAFARLERVLEASPDRTEPRCPLHRRCGGCQIQALSYEKQLEYKEQKVREDLIRIGGFADPPVFPVLGMDEPYHYRNKAQFPFGRNREGRIVTGFYAGRTHMIVPGTDCAIGVPENKQILELILDFIEKHGIAPYDETTGKGLLRHALIRKGFATGELMVCLVINGRSFPHVEELADRLFEIPGMTSFSLNVNQKNTNVILGEEVIPVRGQTYITDRIGGVSYQISPLSFYQVNPVQTEKLYRTALEYAGLTGGETVWELYCGIGTISLFLARGAGQVYGVEVVPQAVEDARRNADLNGITNVVFYLGKAEEVLPEKYEKDGIRADVIVVDPPRKGCDSACLETMLRMEPERIVYVSCDPATLARDLKILCADGRYELSKVQPVDMFPHTAGIENVAQLFRRKI
ncbi:23S rRNA (uracil(1939)-C(5))-methyltransferase RlmD [Lachnoclostridium sp. An131]|uniref:23S rRNA (uracil(1939)-C(5))-methyltransferase RlmD n=1 Tax=Lachnoclostridium sp. An131 TaxID=1965555 RepID=UPI000B3A135F|nr:23S rRNA (uracil(1939)-C(5))-methyltransferase RlmD [Lachnoclostridium sp. An131]OUQ28988.1 23S rRNA (uracil(1939)-C(5))-methyltransferase RlmD [Lachnoclostridium sp. An131]